MILADCIGPFFYCALDEFHRIRGEVAGSYELGRAQARGGGTEFGGAVALGSRERGRGLLITDGRDVVLYANPRMTELAGYSEEGLPCVRWA